MTRTLKLTVEYDGTGYVGWQRQTSGVSIQGLLEDAIEPLAKRRVTVHGAGRTDAGVHALGQVASVTVETPLPGGTVMRALNATLPPQVRVLAVEDAAPAFHARFSAVAKTYEYRIVNAPLVSAFAHRYVWHVPAPLDLPAMRAAAAALAGTRDFAAFQGAGSEVGATVRTVLNTEWQDGGGYDLPLIFRITGDGFLRHMVRNIAGTLIEVGAGRMSPEGIPAILESRDRIQAGPTAPARGLFLAHVHY